MLEYNANSGWLYKRTVGFVVVTNDEAFRDKTCLVPLKRVVNIVFFEDPSAVGNFGSGGKTSEDPYLVVDKEIIFFYHSSKPIGRVKFLFDSSRYRGMHNSVNSKTFWFEHTHFGSCYHMMIFFVLSIMQTLIELSEGIDEKISEELLSRL